MAVNNLQTGSGVHVPKFGEWGSNQNEPYSKAFEMARAGKGVLITPADHSGETSDSEAFVLGEPIAAGFATPPHMSCTRDIFSHHTQELDGEIIQVHNTAMTTTKLHGGEFPEALSKANPKLIFKATSADPQFQLDSASSISQEIEFDYSTEHEWTKFEEETHVPKVGEWDSSEAQPFSEVFEIDQVDKLGGKLEIEQLDGSFQAFDCENHLSRFTASSPKKTLPLSPSDPLDMLPSSSTEPAVNYHNSNQDGEFQQQLTVNKRNMQQMDSCRISTTLNKDHVNASFGPSLSTPAQHDSTEEERQNYQPERQIHRSNSLTTHNGAAVLANKTELRTSTQAWERKTPNDISAAQVDKGAALPKFGEWDAKDPASGEELNFTVIFNKARSEKKTGGPVRPTQLEVKGTTQKDEEIILSKQRTLTKQKSNNNKGRKLACCFHPQATT